ncbi:MAG: HAMP domain-containing sensor histidine kinase [Bacteroidota bacterium]
MQIRQKLTYQFIAFVAIILFLSSIAIYYFSSNYRKEDFYNRLFSKASNTAKLLIEIEEVDSALLKKMEKDNPVSMPDEKITIFDYKNEIIYSSDEENSLKIKPNMLDDIRLEKEKRYKQGSNEVLGFLFADKYDRFVVLISAQDVHGLKKLKNLRTVLAIVFGISIILVFFAGWIYSGRALRPILNVIKQVDNITITSLNLRLDEGNTKDEIAKLSATFNSMLQRLESAFKMQKEFISNASHELRTPLTTITGQLEVVLLNERTADQYKSTIISVLEDMKNLNNIANRLLILAQASSETAETAFSPIRIDDILWSVQSELLKRHLDYHVEISFDISIDDEKKITIVGNEQLIKTTITNLIENGCKYSPDKRVEVNMLAKGKSIILEFIDHGIGIEPSDLNHIFEPFHRGKNAIQFKGHGIGLSLVERVVEMHSGEIRVVSEVNKGSTFTLILPSAIF